MDDSFTMHTQDPSPTEEDSFQTRRLDSYKLFEAEGSLTKIDSDGRNTELWIFEDQKGDKQVVKFINPYIRSLNLWSGFSYSDKAVDIKLFFTTLQKFIGADNFTPSQVQVIDHPDNGEQIAIIQDFLITDEEIDQYELERQLKTIKEKYNNMREEGSFPQRWIPRTYDYDFLDNDVFVINGKIVITDWL